jgi:septal ring factor EnvC (AmiA/AmiB activator)
MHRTLRAIALVLATLGAGSRAQAEPDAGTPNPAARARARAAFLSQRSLDATRAAQAQAIAAYRLARRRAATFLPVPERRAAETRTVDAALLVLRRTVAEANVLQAELAETIVEQQALENRREPSAENAGQEPLGLTPFRLLRPIPGSIVARPGLHRDPATSAEARRDGVQILGRLNQPVRAPDDGEVRKVVPLPQGGFALVLGHADHRVTILSGLRQANVNEGMLVERGAAIGLLGRNLDGAPILTIELWRAGAPLDPTRQLDPR